MAKLLAERPGPRVVAAMNASSCGALMELLTKSLCGADCCPCQAKQESAGKAARLKVGLCAFCGAWFGPGKGA